MIMEASQCSEIDWSLQVLFGDDDNDDDEDDADDDDDDDDNGDGASQ